MPAPIQSLNSAATLLKIAFRHIQALTNFEGAQWYARPHAQLGDRAPCAGAFSKNGRVRV